MFEKIIKKEKLVLLPKYDLEIYKSLDYTIGNVIVLYNEIDKKDLLEIINKSTLKKIYLVGDNDMYDYLIPKIKNKIEICWIFKNSFASLSNYYVRIVLKRIMEYIDKGMVNSIGCINQSTKKVFENAGYNCEYIKIQIGNSIKINNKICNTIGLLSNDFDPNNNYYNQLAALKFVKFDYLKTKCFMGETYLFTDFFNIKMKNYEKIEEVMSNNFVNLYINFTNTNLEMIQNSFASGVPCIIGNCDFFESNEYLNNCLTIKSCDDVNEIAQKINFVKENKLSIMNEYKKFINENN